MSGWQRVPHGRTNLMPLAAALCLLDSRTIRGQPGVV
jgi:hypothetical protein